MDIQTEVQRVLKNEADAILTTAHRLKSAQNQTQLEKIFRFLDQALNNGGKLVMTGLGKSGKIAQKMAATFASTGSPAIFLHPTEAQHGDLGLMTASDVVMAISYSGKTPELLQLLPSLKNLGVPLIALVGDPQSELAQKADVLLDTSVEEEACPNQLAPTTSTTVVLALGDALAITRMQLKGFDQKRFAELHPGGALGNRLKLKVRDLMHSGEAIACVQPDTPIQDVIVHSTEKKLGAALVTEGKTLRGIVTDGDLRRALAQQKKFFSFKAKDVMTVDPVCIQKDELAQDALRLMEDRPSQISVLPVVEKDNEWIGLIRLHDVINAF